MNGTIPWVKTLDLNDSLITTTQEKITQLALDETHLSILPVGTVLIAMYGGFNQIGRTGILEIEATHNQAMTALLPTSKVNPYFLNAILVASKDYWKSVANSTRKDPNITKSDVLRFKFPLPPIAIQQEIVTEIEGYQKVINGARAVIDNYRPHIAIDPDWKIVELEKLCVIKSGATPDRSNDSFWDGDIPWVTTTLINYEVIHQANEFITLEGLKNSSTWIVPKGTVLMAMYGQGVTRGRVAILGIDAAINQACAAFQIKDN